MKKSRSYAAQKDRIVLDTNVLVSGLLNPAGSPADVLKFILEEKVILLLNAEIFAEYREVLKRPKFDFDPFLSELLLDTLYQVAEIVTALPLNIEIPDKSDLKFLETAIAGHAQALVTGNKIHFPKQNKFKLSILSPKEFIDSQLLII